MDAQRIRIEVTERDIETARKKVKRGFSREECCPIALAANRTFPGYRAFASSWLRLEKCADKMISYVAHYPWSRRAKKFICDFDMKDKVRPSVFILNIVRYSLYPG
jgi:hypothetical protein